MSAEVQASPLKISGLGATPAKRPRMELLEEKDEDEGNFTDFLQPHNSTYEPVDSFVEASELR